MSLKAPLLRDKGDNAGEEVLDHNGSKHHPHGTDREGCNDEHVGKNGVDEASKIPHSYGSLGFEKQSQGTAKTSPFLIWLTFLAACGSFLFGYDTGIVSGSMLYLREEFELNVIQQEAVVSVTIGAAALFSLVGGYLNHCLGRKPTIILASITFTAGAIILGLAINLAMLIIGRLIIGIGIGLSSMTVPIYVAECSLPKSRGRLVTMHQLMITVGMLTANIFAGAFSYVHMGWRYMLGLACIPSVLQLMGFVFMPESPRWLVSKNKLMEAEDALLKIRGRADVSEELSAIKNAYSSEDNTSVIHLIGRMLRTRTVRRALVIGCGLQMFQQIAGINTVMYYTATIMKMAGVRDNSLAIWLSCTVAGCNVFMTIVALYFIDRVGRKPLVVVSFIGVFISLVVLAVGFQLAAVNSPLVGNDLSSPECSRYDDCDRCNASPDCGFCYLDNNKTVTNGSCLLSSGAYSANSASGQCTESEREVLGTIWAYDFCPTDDAWVVLLGMIMYIVSFAPGLATIPWAMNSEIYPLWARSAGNAMATATNWTFNLIVAMTFLSFTTTLTKYGTYWMYSGLAFVGILFVTTLVPETKGRSLEEMEKVMAQPWLVCPRL